MNTTRRQIIVVAACGLAALELAALAGAQPAYDALAAAFQTPPADARPQVWWHWMNGNVSRAGITADLEAMKEIGLGGAQIFNVSESIPDGPAPFMSPQWRELLQFAVAEADRLGLKLCIHNCSGWSSSGGPWITPEVAMQEVAIRETPVKGPAHFSEVLPAPDARLDFYRDIAVLALPAPRDDQARIKDLKPKAGYEGKYGQWPQLDTYPADAVIPRAGILDLTARLAADGKLTWDVPAGDWIVQRIGYRPTGAQNAPSPVSGRGLECDKLSRAGLDAHWAGGMAKILQDLGPLAGKTLNNCLIDSYEVGHQNWTPRFREEFQARRGYDPLPYLPVLAGRIIESGEVSERFLYDLRRTVADLFAENYYGYFAELCHKHGLLASIEPYDGPFECLLAGRGADLPMGEFWVGGGESESCKLAASVGHIYGRPIIGAESFTADPDHGAWRNHPYALKAVGDLMYCAGINRYIVHRYAHQPWLDRLPGMTMGQWGTHFERTTTWWKPGGPAWVQYLARCQSLLQQGTFVADVCYFAGEVAPNGAPYHPELKAAGYDYDACNADVLLNKMTVQDGRLTLPSGMSYRVLVLPNVPFMTPQLLAKVRALVEQGAVVVGPKPLRSPSLQEYPKCDEDVRRMADEVWGDCDGRMVKEHAFGKGRVIWGERKVLGPPPPAQWPAGSVEPVLVELRTPPDCSFTWVDANVRAAVSRPGGEGIVPPKMAWIHRRTGDCDVYFISNPRPEPADIGCNFRIAGARPEIWHADTGLREPAPVWFDDGAKTVVRIPFVPAGSVFVVFRRGAEPPQPAAGPDHLAWFNPARSVHRGTAPAGPGSSAPAPAPRPQIEIRKAVYEAVDGAGGADVTDKVAALVGAGELSIPANNATFGDPTYLHVKRLRVEYTIDGQAQTRVVEENGTLVPAEFPQPPPAYKLLARDGQLELQAFQAGAYEYGTPERNSGIVQAKSVPAPLELSGPWTLRFPPNWGAPAEIRLDKLISWTEHPDAGVRYFSGTAEYQQEFELSAELLNNGRAQKGEVSANVTASRSSRAFYLDLGRVQCLAEVALNGQNLGVWWKPPFMADVTAALKPGRNTLVVRVTNLWVNRLIGDEQYPDDCEWNGKPLKQWPDWFAAGQPRPVPQRLTFTTWKHYTRDSTVLESGLLGPVLIRAAERLPIK